MRKKALAKIRNQDPATKEDLVLLGTSDPMFYEDFEDDMRSSNSWDFDRSEESENIFDQGMQNFDSHENKFKIRQARLLNPESSLIRFWNLIMFFLMVYTAVIMPFKVSFIDENYLAWSVFDTIVDIFFIMDIVINFNMPYFDSNNCLVTKRSSIFFNYIKGWLLLDLVSSIPMEILEMTILDSEIF